MGRKFWITSTKFPNENKEEKKIEGLGDVAKVFFQKTGIEKVYKKLNPQIEGECSPCEARRKAANESKISKMIFKKK